MVFKARDSSGAVKRVVIGALVCLLVYLAGFNAQWRMSPDSAVNAVVARHLLRGGSFVSAAELGIGAMKLQPGLPWLMAGSMHVFGEGVLWPLTCLVWALALIGLGILYRLLRWHFHPTAALGITALAAINLTYYESSLRLLTETPFAFGLLVILLGYEWFVRGAQWRSIAGMGLMVAGVVWMALFRSVALVAVAALLGAMLWQAVRGPGRGRVVAALLAMGAGLLALRALDPRLSAPWALNADEQRVVMLMTTKLDYVARSVLGSTHLPKMLDEAVSETLLGVDLDPISGAVLASLTLIGVVRLFQVRPLWGLTVCGFVAQVLLFRAALARYFVVIVPLLAVAWWLSAWTLRAWLPTGAGKAVCVGMLVVWLGCNTARMADLAWEQRQARPMLHYREGRYPLLAKFGAQLRAHVAATRPRPMVLKQGAAHPELVWYADVWMRPTTRYFERDRPPIAAGRPVYLVTQTTEGVARTARRLGRKTVGPIMRQAYPKGGDWRVYQLVE